MIQKFSKLGRCFAMAAHSGVSEAPHVDWIESSEEGTIPKCCARNSEGVGSCPLCHFERFRRVSLVESFERPKRGQVTELDRRILRVALFEVRLDLVSLHGLVQKRQRKGRSIIGVPASVQRQCRRRASFRLRTSFKQRIPGGTSAFKLG